MDTAEEAYDMVSSCAEVYFHCKYHTFALFDWCSNVVLGPTS